MEHRNTLAPRLAAARDELRNRRAARAARRTLEREIASFRTHAELNELTAMLARHSDDEVAEIRQILDRHHIAA